MVTWFYNRKAELWRTVRNETTMITSFVKQAEFKCALQNIAGEDMWEKFGREINRVIRAYRFFSDYLDVQIGDKIIIDNEEYIVNSANVYKGSFRVFCKAYLIKWEGKE